MGAYMGEKIILEHQHMISSNDTTTTRLKQKQHIHHLENNNHIKAPHPLKKSSFPPSVGQNDLETTTGSHKNFIIWHGTLLPLLPCANSPHFREHIMVSWGSTTAESEGNRISEHVAFHLCMFPCQLLTTM